MLSDEYRSKILRLLEANPQLSQRELAERLGISLGKANYCLRALIARGMVKARNFKNSQNRSTYLYLLTRRGILEKSRATARFLKIKMNQYDALHREIAALKREQAGR
jgi:EPS-associated MarR family transcriptional regulator